MRNDIKTPEDFGKYVKEVESRDGYRRPLAFGIGIAHTSEDGNILDTFFPFPNYNQNHGSAAVFADVLGHLAGTKTYQLDNNHKQAIYQRFSPFLSDGKQHGNIDAVTNLFTVLDYFLKNNGGKTIVISFIDQPESDPGPQSVSDAYLRLHLLSHRLVKPNEINLDGIFGKLPNNIWTNEGPISPEDFPQRQIGAMGRQQPLHINGVDKFPRMVDYVIPSGVRIADASRVRLGAYVGEGTTVMHEGFINFNAGTITGGEEPKAMVEGRISAGVVVGNQTDIGGGASIMGTLSGGGEEKITIGRGCLLGANGGTGISLGDLCAIEAGLYVKASTKLMYNGSEVKASELSGKDGLTFRCNSLSGAVEALDQPNKVVLNEVLHQN